jgi:hypothetical protein
MNASFQNGSEVSAASKISSFDCVFPMVAIYSGATIRQLKKGDLLNV